MTNTQEESHLQDNIDFHVKNIEPDLCSIDRVSVHLQGDIDLYSPAFFLFMCSFTRVSLDKAKHIFNYYGVCITSQGTVYFIY